MSPTAKPIYKGERNEKNTGNYKMRADTDAKRSIKNWFVKNFNKVNPSHNQPGIEN